MIIGQIDRQSIWRFKLSNWVFFLQRGERSVAVKRQDNLKVGVFKNLDSDLAYADKNRDRQPWCWGVQNIWTVSSAYSFDAKWCGHITRAGFCSIVSLSWSLPPPGGTQGSLAGFCPTGFHIPIFSPAVHTCAELTIFFKTTAHSGISSGCYEQLHFRFRDMKTYENQCVTNDHWHTKEIIFNQLHQKDHAT